MAPNRKQRAFLPLSLAAVCAGSLWSCLHSSVKDVKAFAGASKGKVWSFRSAGRQALPAGDMSTKKMEELMNDPKAMEAAQKEMAEMMKDPQKAKAMEEVAKSMAEGVEKLKQDPSMAQFFKDIEEGGFEAIKKYENNEEILAKFSQATGGPMGMAGMPGMPGAPPTPPAATAFKPGDEVFIRGLKAAPELNGKKAMVVPPTPEEREKIEGTTRLIVRVIETGDQYAVKPENLFTTDQEVDNVMSNNLEDVSIYSPAVQEKTKELKESGILKKLEEDPELKHVFEDIKENGMEALQKYWSDEELMAKISKAMQA